MCVRDHAVPQCLDSTCEILACDVGWADGNDDPSDGCELPCSFTGPEVCDGDDNDCDGQEDEGAPLPPASFCGTDTGACVRGTPQCDAGAIVCTGRVDPVAESCNTVDDDCDGEIDENYGSGDSSASAPARACAWASWSANGGGRARTARPGADSHETARRDDDATVDRRGHRRLGVAGATADDRRSRNIGSGVRIFQYEGSRPDATSSNPGAATRLACSTTTRLPWTNVTWDEASDACCALNPGGTCSGAYGWQLCDGADWERACESSTGTCTWGYGTNCTTANGQTSAAQLCNGKEYDCNSGQSATRNADVDGSFAQCRDEWGVSTC